MANHFEVHDAQYPMPAAFKMGDPVLVEEVTGLSWREFAARVDEQEEDPVVMLGMLAVAVWQTNPRWRRDRVVRFVEGLSIGDVKYVGEETSDAGPPAEQGSSNGSTPVLSERQDFPSGTTPPSTTPDGSPLTSQVLG